MEIKRRDDIELGIGPLRVRASGKTVSTVILALCVVGAIFYHDMKSDAGNKEILKALWVQTYVVMHPEGERKAAVDRLPPEIKATLIKQEVASGTGPSNSGN